MPSFAASPPPGRLAPLCLRAADPTRDPARLAELARACPQGRRLQFYYRRHGLGERCRLHGNSEIFVAEQGDQVIAAATISLKEMWIHGVQEPVAYFFDRMVRPEYRQRGVGRTLLRCQIEATEYVRLRYGLVLEDNHAARGLLESEGFQAHPRRLRYYALLPGLVRQRTRRPLYLDEPGTPRLSNRLDSYLRPLFAFLDSSAESGDGLLHLGENTPDALAVLYRHEPKVFTRAPWHHRLLSRFLSVVPPLGRPVESWSITHLWSREPAALTELLAGVAAAAQRSGIPLILVPLFDHDPRIGEIRCHTVNGWGIPATRVCLYLHGPLAPSLLRSDQLLLASGRDG